MVPNALDVKEFARSRMKEINLITKELDQAKYSSTRRTFQQLPRHMRRRAASYNIKRLPTRLRLKAIEEVLLIALLYDSVFLIIYLIIDESRPSKRKMFQEDEKLSKMA